MDRGEVLELLIAAQFQAALTNNNASSAIVRQMAAVGEPFEKAVAAGLLSLGGPYHAPVTEARRVLFRATDDELREQLKAGKRLAGFGNAFYRDDVDPAFKAFFDCIDTHYTEISGTLAYIMSVLAEEKGRVLYPNAAAATAIVSELCGLAHGTEIQLLLMGRLPAWAQQWVASRK